MKAWAIERNGRLVAGVVAAMKRAVWWELQAKYNGERPVDSAAYARWLRRQARDGYRAVRVNVTRAESSHPVRGRG